jgi:hypothetical protein
MGAYEYQGPTLYFEDHFINLPENPRKNQLIDSIKAFYFDYGTPTLSIISGNNGFVSYDETNGYLYVNDSSLFNYELQDTIKIKFRANVNVINDTAELLIVVQDVNERPKLDTVYVTIAEHSNKNFIIDTIQRFDEDYNSQITYQKNFYP